MSLSCVLYTDGSARPNPGNIGWGVHGYTYQNITDKPIIVQKHTITDHGYLYPEHIKEHMKSITPEEYIDIVGSLDTNCGTNNQAEISAIQTALNHIIETEVTKLLLLSDSEYSINMIKDYMKTKRRSNYAANSELWGTVYDAVDACLAKNITMVFKWIKGHSANVGNDISDYLSVIGTNHSIDEKQILNKTISPAKKYWDGEVVDNPFLSFNRCYFNSQSRFNIIGQYFIADPGPNDLSLGKRTSETGLAVIKLHQPDPILEQIKDKQFSVNNEMNNIIMINLDKVYTPQVYKYLNTYGKYCLLKNKRFNSLDFIDNKPITVEINPIGLSLKAIEAFNVLEGLLEKYHCDCNSVTTIDITDRFYELETIKKKEQLVLKKELSNGIKNIDIFTDIDGKNTKIPLVLSIDLPNRNKLKKLETSSPKIKLILWSKNNFSFRYCCMIESDLGIGIWSNYYADRIFQL